MSDEQRDALTRCVKNLNSYFKRLPRTQEMTVHQLNSLDYLYKVEDDLKKTLNGESNGKKVKSLSPEQGSKLACTPVKWRITSFDIHHQIKSKVDEWVWWKVTWGIKTPVSRQVKLQVGYQVFSKVKNEIS